MVSGMSEDMRSTTKNAMANESRPRLLGGMATVLTPPALKIAVRCLPPFPFISTPSNVDQKMKARSTKGAAQVPQSTRKTRQDTNKLPGKPDRLIEEVILSTPKKKTTKIRTKKTTEKKASTPKIIKPRASKVTKKKTPAKPLAKNATVKKAAVTPKGQKAVAAKGKRHSRLVEKPMTVPSTMPILLDS